MHPFRVAVEAQDIDGAIALLADDVVFRSPVVYAPYHGRESVAPILSAAARVFEQFRYQREIGARDARDHALVFTARIGDRDVEGCDFVRINEHGLVDDLCVMVRPLSAVVALAEAMRVALEAHG
jgi:hypothetical protein